MLATYMAISEICGAVKEENGGVSCFDVGCCQTSVVTMQAIPAQFSRDFKWATGISSLDSHNASCYQHRVLVFLRVLPVDQVSSQCKLLLAQGSRVSKWAAGRSSLGSHNASCFRRASPTRTLSLVTGFFPSSVFALRSVFAVTIAIKSGKNYNLLDGDLDNGKCRLPPHA